MPSAPTETFSRSRVLRVGGACDGASGAGERLDAATAAAVGDKDEALAEGVLPAAEGSGSFTALIGAENRPITTNRTAIDLFLRLFYAVFILS